MRTRIQHGSRAVITVAGIGIAILVGAAAPAMADLLPGVTVPTLPPVTLAPVPTTLPTLATTLPPLPTTLPTVPVTVPTVTVPTAVTLPPVTLPTVTVPTIPGVTLPPVTLPPLSLPGVTLPGVTLPTLPSLGPNAGAASSAPASGASGPSAPAATSGSSRSAGTPESGGATPAGTRSGGHAPTNPSGTGIHGVPAVQVGVLPIHGRQSAVRVAAISVAVTLLLITAGAEILVARRFFIVP